VCGGLIIVNRQPSLLFNLMCNTNPSSFQWILPSQIDHENGMSAVVCDLDTVRAE